MNHEKTRKKKSQIDTDGYKLIKDIREIISQARSLTRLSVNSLQVMSNYLIGKRLVESEQHGKGRADYGKGTLKQLSAELTQEFGRGYSATNLEYMRKFYRIYGASTELIPQTPSKKTPLQKPQTVSEELSFAQLSRTLSGELPLSWSHYLFLMGISSPDERRFYEREVANEGWSLRELKSQFASSLYERLALSRDKAGVKELSEKGQLVEKHDDVIKDPYVLEFLGLDEKTRYSETQLETAIIDKL